jgi:hypothetical protein
MMRKIVIALAAVTFAGAMAASTAADARMGGGGGGGGRGGGGFGGGIRGGSFHSAMVGGGIRSGRFVGSRNFAFRPGAARFNRVAFARFHRFHRARFAFASVGLYGGSCWSWQPTPWGWQRVWACDYDY